VANHDDTESKLRTAVERGTELATTGGIAALAVASATQNPTATQSATAAAIVAMFPLAVSICISLGFGATKWRVDRWWQALIRNSGARTPEELQGTIEAHSCEPYVQQTIVESIRRLLEAVDEASAPALGTLAAEYIRGKMAPDPFFRGLARVLCDASGEELADLRDMLSRCAPHAIDGHITMWDHIELSAGTGTGVHIGGDAQIIGDYRHATRLFRMLKSNDLGRTSKTSVGPRRLREDASLLIEHDIVIRILGVLGPA
jgi:hypothetical protein